jgi:hypothetical protein
MLFAVCHRFAIFIIGFMGFGMYEETEKLDEFAIGAFSGVDDSCVNEPMTGAGSWMLENYKKACLEQW